MDWLGCPLPLLLPLLRGGEALTPCAPGPVAGTVPRGSVFAEGTGAPLSPSEGKAVSVRNGPGAGPPGSIRLGESPYACPSPLPPIYPSLHSSVHPCVCLPIHPSLPKPRRKCVTGLLPMRTDRHVCRNPCVSGSVCWGTGQSSGPTGRPLAARAGLSPSRWCRHQGGEVCAPCWGPGDSPGEHLRV